MGVALTLLSFYLVGAGFDTGISHGSRLLVNIIGPIGLGPFIALEVIGIDIHRAGYPAVIGISFAFWFTAGIIVVAFWRGLRKRS